MEVDKNRDIYYEYMEIKSLNDVYHLVNVDSDGYSFLIPVKYTINYSQSSNNYEKQGHIYFYTDKYTYSLDYIKKEYEDFKIHMEKKGNKVKKKFVNYKERVFYEVYSNDVDYIYTYYDGYYYKICSNHKLSLNEYYDMYFILFSISREKIDKSISTIKELIYYHNNYLTNLVNNNDLLVQNLSMFTDNIDIVSSDIIIYNDEEYIKYKKMKNKIYELSHNIFINYEQIETKIIHSDNKWNIISPFDFKCLGKYFKGIIIEHSEITDSDELKEDEKILLLEKILMQKQYEINSYEDKIKEMFYKFLLNYLENNVNYEKWDSFHLREFVNLDYIDNYDELDDNSIYQIFIDNIKSNFNILNERNVENSINGLEIVIYPDKYILKLNAMNNFLNSFKILINEDLNLKFIDKN